MSPALPAAVVRIIARHRLGIPTLPKFVHSRWPRSSASVDPALDAADFLESVDRGVRLGSSVRGAIIASATQHPNLDDVLRVVVLHCRTGAPLDDDEVLRDAERHQADGAFLVRSLVTANSGGPSASYALQRAAWALRERHAVRAERRAHAAQAVFASRVLSWLPLAFGVMMVFTNGSVRGVYFGRPIGLVCLVVGLSLNFAGRRWMHRIAGTCD